MLRPEAMYLDEGRCSSCELCYLIAPVIRDNPQRIPVSSATLEAMAACPSGAIEWLENSLENSLENKGRGVYQLDVRPLSPRERRALIFRTFDALAAGDAFELINDHGPRPLYHPFQWQRRGQVPWVYLETGPERWRVKIGRV